MSITHVNASYFANFSDIIRLVVELFYDAIEPRRNLPLLSVFGGIKGVVPSSYLN